jgi:two-component system LytT family sensor kinase
VRVSSSAAYTMAVGRRLRSGLTIFGFFTAVGLSFFWYKYLDVAARGGHVRFAEPLVEELTGAWMAAILFPLIAAFARRFPIGRSNFLSRGSMHLGMLVLFSVAHTCLLWLSRNLVFPLLGLGRYDYGIMTMRFPMEFFHDTISYCVMVSILYLFDHRVRSSQLEGKLAAARLQNLRLQLQPHFLFNALNTISSVMYEDPRKADAMISGLSDLLRSTLADSDAQEVPLDHEVQTLELYLDIMRRRFEDKLTVDVQVAPEVRQALVPQLLLQPLVENSLRYGLDPRTNAVSVTVTAERDGDAIRLQVRDHGRGINGNFKKGTGLSNTAERLKQLYGPHQKLEWRNCEGGGLLVTVAVPFHTRCAS